MRHTVCLWAGLFMAPGWLFGAVPEQPPSAPPGLSVARSGQLLLAGQPYRGVGANYFDVFLRVLHQPTNTSSLRGLEQLGRSGIPFVRFAANFGARDQKRYLENRDAYLQSLDKVVKTAEACKVGLIPSLLWQFDLPDLLGEHRDQWGNPESKTMVAMREYVGELVERYKDSPAIWAWEFGNEANLAVDLPNAAQFRRKDGTERDDLKSQHIIVAMNELVREVRRHDTWRPVFSGNSHPRPSAWHNSHEGTWKPDSREQSREMILRDNPEAMGTITVHVYGTSAEVKELSAWAASRLEWLQWLTAIGRETHRPVWVGEFGLASHTDAPSRQDFAEMLEDMQKAKVDLAAFWVFDLESQKRDWSVTFSNDRAFMLEMTAEANRRWNQEVR